MTENNFPTCPICKREILLPFSIMQFGASTISDKTYGSWVCSNYGFFISTRDTRGINPEKDVEAGFNESLRKKIEDLRKSYNKKNS